MVARIDYNSSGNLDDVTVDDVSMFRLEYMDSGRIWIRLYRDNDEDIVFWLNSKSIIDGRREETE